MGVDLAREVNATFVRSIFDGAHLRADHLWARDAPGIAAWFARAYAKEGVGGLGFSCPGCLQVVFCGVDRDNPDKHPKWDWNGDRERPTLSPSIVHDKAKGGCGWHGFLTAGRFQLHR